MPRGDGVLSAGPLPPPRRRAGILVKEFRSRRTQPLPPHVIVSFDAPSSPLMAHQNAQRLLQRYPAMLAIDRALHPSHIPAINGETSTGLKIMLLLRLSPLIPFSPLNYLMCVFTTPVCIKGRRIKDLFLSSIFLSYTHTHTHTLTIPLSPTPHPHPQEPHLPGPSRLLAGLNRDAPRHRRLRLLGHQRRRPCCLLIKRGGGW